MSLGNLILVIVGVCVTALVCIWLNWAVQRGADAFISGDDE